MTQSGDFTVSEVCEIFFVEPTTVNLWARKYPFLSVKRINGHGARGKRWIWSIEDINKMHNFFNTPKKSRCPSTGRVKK